MATYYILHIQYTIFEMWVSVLSETAIAAVGEKVSILMLHLMKINFNATEKVVLVLSREVLYDCNMFSWVKCEKERRAQMKKEREENDGESCKQHFYFFTSYVEVDVKPRKQEMLLLQNVYNAQSSHWLKRWGIRIVKEELCIHVLYSNLVSHDHKIFDWKILFLPFVVRVVGHRLGFLKFTIAHWPKMLKLMTLISIYLSIYNCKKWC